MKVLIIGAGPAGCAAAIRLLEVGIAVTLVDKARFPRSAPGETLHPGVEPLLAQLGVKTLVEQQGSIRQPGIWVENSSGKTFSAYSDENAWQGFQFVRDKFDQILLDRAMTLGAEFIDNIVPNGLSLTKDGYISAIRLDAALYKADYFIDASGGRAWLANRLKLEFKKYSKTLLANFGHALTPNADQYSEPRFIWHKNGWTWLAQIDKNCVSWAKLNLESPKSVPGDWLPPELKAAKPVGKVQGRNVTWRIAEKPAAKNYFLAGDAASVLDPSSSHGVLKAIMSGIMVAHLIRQMENHSHAEVQNYYQQWISTWFESDVERLKTLYESQIMGFSLT